MSVSTLISFPLPRNTGVLFAALALAFPALARAQSSYSITDLGALSGMSNSVGAVINSNGLVAGHSYDSSHSHYNATLYSNSSLMSLRSLGGTQTYAFGINDGGVVVGMSSAAGNKAQRAVRWKGAVVTDLGDLGGLNSRAQAINAAEVITGNADLADGSIHAFRYSGDAMTDLGTLGGSSSSSSGYAINAGGQIAGAANTACDATIEAVRWTGETIELLPSFGYGGFGVSINDSGQVAGYALQADGVTKRAVRWTGTTGFDMGTLGGDNSVARSMNNSSVVVGWSDLADGSQRAFIAPGDQMLDLNAVLPADSGWTLTYASSINNKGWITGQGFHNGSLRAFVLKPDGATVTGRIALEGVMDLSLVSAAAPPGTFHLSFRTPGTTTELYGRDVTLATAPGSEFGTYLAAVPAGTYDVAIKGDKTLRAIQAGVVISGPLGTVSDITLPAGDANNDNSVDSSDFGVLIGAFNTTASPVNEESNGFGSGYDAAADFDYDGVVDSNDFALLIGNFNTFGAD